MNEKNEHTEFELLTGKYLAGDASQEEIKKLEQWVRSSKENKKLFLDYKRAWQLTEREDAKVNTERAWETVRKKLFAEEKEIPSIKPVSGSTGMRPLWRIAAVAVVLISVGFLLIFLLRSPQNELIAYDSIISEKLEDGSEITLNRHSKIIYPEQFGKKERRVELEGDAYFDVTREEDKPFIVETYGLKVKVLGTSFYVDAKPDKETIEVIVSSGRVALLTEQGNTLELTAGEKGIFNKKANTLLEKSNPDENFLSWKTKKIRFDNAGLERVAQVIAGTYHVDVQLGQPGLKNCRLTATFDNQSLDDVLLIIEETLDIEVVKTDSAIIFSGNGCR